MLVKRNDNTITIALDETSKPVLVMTLAQSLLLADTLQHAQRDSFAWASLGDPNVCLLSQATNTARN